MKKYKKRKLTNYEDTTEFRHFLSDTADIHETIVGFIPKKYDQKTLEAILQLYKDLKIAERKPKILAHYVFWLINMYNVEYKNYVSQEEKAKFIENLDNSIGTNLLSFLQTYSQFDFTTKAIVNEYFK